ncbi:MAG TPA: tyrosine-type recombinase/integrase [Gemmatimonadaceae bacterium]|nr:tyrosine-type recombinase/integrase [Gemmatimonadaceae bacterium]
MAAAYRRGRRLSIRVPQEGKPAKVVSTGTGDRATARAMKLLVEQLADQKRWRLLSAVTSGPRKKRLPLSRLLAAARTNGLDALEASVTEADLREHIPGWQAWLRANLREGSRMLDRYPVLLAELIAPGEPFGVSRFTDPKVLHAWIVAPPRRVNRASKGGESLRWQRKTVASSFARYLLSLGVIRHNPVRDLPPVKKPSGRDRWLPLDDVIRLVEAHDEPFRTIAAIREGAGGEISAVLGMLRRDVDTTTWMLRLRGRKTPHRDRIARLRPWARSYVERYLAAHPMHPDAPLFPGVTYWQSYEAHVAACARAKIADYHLHDARHSFAVQSRKAGVRDELIAANLGHADTSQVHRVYGKYTPSVEDWERAEQGTATTRPAKGRGRKGT